MDLGSNFPFVFLTTPTISSITYTKMRNTLTNILFYSENDIMDMILDFRTLNDVMEGSRYSPNILRHPHRPTPFLKKVGSSYEPRYN